jgi:tetratricopeptide (TPR) repeat protein
MAQYSNENRPRLRRHWREEAIQLAMASRWAEAVTVNKRIIELFPDDVEAFNRLGRSLTELGQYAEARTAYQQSLQKDPNNVIAQKNLQRLSQVDIDAEPVVASAMDKIDPRLGNAEAGRSGIVRLVQVPDKTTLSRMNAGDQVRLQIEGRALMVYNARGERLGQADPRPSQRVIDLMKGGNRYAAAILTPEEGHIQIIIQETYQHPDQTGKLAFPTKGGPATAVRSYIRDSMLQYGLDDDDDDDEGEDTVETASDREEPVEDDFSPEDQTIV